MWMQIFDLEIWDIDSFVFNNNVYWNQYFIYPTVSINIKNINDKKILN